jgi:hypothetical protein
MADNIGGFKINGTVVAGPRLARQEEAPDPVLGTFNRDFNPVLCSGLIITRC